jgi:hypothetical protein
MGRERAETYGHTGNREMGRERELIPMDTRVRERWGGRES